MLDVADEIRIAGVGHPMVGVVPRHAVRCCRERNLLGHRRRWTLGFRAGGGEKGRGGEFGECKEGLSG